MDKAYKGYELMKAIAEGEIRQETRFLDLTDKREQNNGSRKHYYSYRNGNFIKEGTGGNNLLSILNHDFKLLEDEKINTQEMEELNLYMSTIEYTWQDVDKNRMKINEIIRVVNGIQKELLKIICEQAAKELSEEFEKVKNNCK